MASACPASRESKSGLSIFSKIPARSGSLGRDAGSSDTIRIAIFCLIAGVLAFVKFYVMRPPPPGPHVASIVPNSMGPDEDPRRRSRVQMTGHTEGILSVAFFHDGKRAVTGSADHTIRIWDLATGKEIQKLEGHTDYVTGIAVSQDDSLVASCSRDQTCHVWDVKSGDQIALLQGHYQWVVDVVFVHGNKIVATTGSDGTIRFWDVFGSGILKMKRKSGDLKAIRERSYVWQLRPMDDSLPARRVIKLFVSGMCAS
jgi:hypothetical protein